MTRPAAAGDGRTNFSCRMDACGHSCCGAFDGPCRGLVSLERRPFSEIVLTPGDCARLSACGRADLVEAAYSELAGRSYCRMPLNADGSCRALVGGRCAVNACKPTLCRAFPFYMDMFAGLCAVPCEGFEGEPSAPPEDLAGSLEAVRAMYRFWLDFYSDAPFAARKGRNR